jgi:hypothetical protein
MLADMGCDSDLHHNRSSSPMASCLQQQVITLLEAACSTAATMQPKCLVELAFTLSSHAQSAQWQQSTPTEKAQPQVEAMCKCCCDSNSKNDSE